MASQGNMIVPIDLLKPILSDLMTRGRVDRPARPWLGMYTSSADDTVFVAGVAGGGPAERAGIKAGDFVLEVAGARVTDLADTFRRIWAVGPAGSAIPLTIVRDGALQRVTIQSADRDDFLKKPRLH
jgi:S1-C subfamily serine protease